MTPRRALARSGAHRAAKLPTHWPEPGPLGSTSFAPTRVAATPPSSSGGRRMRELETESLASLQLPMTTRLRPRLRRPGASNDTASCGDTLANSQHAGLPLLVLSIINHPIALARTLLQVELHPMTSQVLLTSAVRQFIRLTHRPVASVAHVMGWEIPLPWRRQHYMSHGIARFGPHTYGTPTIPRFVDDRTSVAIGAYCSISRSVVFIPGGGHRNDWISGYPFRRRWGLHGAGTDGHRVERGDIVVGNDVWIGFGATVLGGVTIGDGAVIGAQSVVTRDVPPYTIVAGNPARVIRTRLSAHHIGELQALQWWYWPEARVRAAIPFLNGPPSALDSADEALGRTARPAPTQVAPDAEHP
jgi:acetyltransferase-like isoleucine patch superfamily enzyme